MSQQVLDLAARQHDGNAVRTLGAHEVVEPGEVLLQHGLVQEEQRGKSLVLGRGAHASARGEVGEERHHFCSAQLGGMAPALGGEEAPHPAAVTRLGATAQVP